MTFENLGIFPCQQNIWKKKKKKKKKKIEQVPRGSRIPPAGAIS